MAKKVVVVNDMFECPFSHEFTYQLSELTSGTDTHCSLTKDHSCILERCPLKKAGEIIVRWEVEPK